MTAAEWLRVVVVALVLAAGLPVLRRVTVGLGAGAELSRKSVHVVLGLACLAFPWVFAHPWQVWALAGLATVLLLVLRWVPALRAGPGAILHGVGRWSFGELCFAPAVAAVFHLARGEVTAYVIPLAVLTLADSAGALAGTRWGRKRYGSGTHFKTHLGSAAFLLAAWCCTALPLVLWGRVEWPQAALIGVVLGVLTMMAEGMSDRGFDNLVVPLLAVVVLDRLLPLGSGELVIRAAWALALLGLTWACSRWSTLDGGALLGAALLGYACAVLAGWRFVLPPLALFAAHLVTTRRHRLMPFFQHRLDSVLAQGLVCLPWVLAAGRGWLDPAVALAGVAFGTAAHLALLDAATRRCGAAAIKPAWWSAAKGWLVAASPGMIWLAADWHLWWAAAAAAAAATWLAVRLVNRLTLPLPISPGPARLLQGLIALSCSAFAIG